MEKQKRWILDRRVGCVAVYWASEEKRCLAGISDSDYCEFYAGGYHDPITGGWKIDPKNIYDAEWWLEELTTKNTIPQTDEQHWEDEPDDYELGYEFKQD